MITIVWQSAVLAIAGVLLLRISGRKFISQMTIPQVGIFLTLGTILGSQIGGKGVGRFARNHRSKTLDSCLMNQGFSHLIIQNDLLQFVQHLIGRKHATGSIPNNITNLMGVSAFKGG